MKIVKFTFFGTRKLSGLKIAQNQSFGSCNTRWSQEIQQKSPEKVPWFQISKPDPNKIRPFGTTQNRSSKWQINDNQAKILINSCSFFKYFASQISDIKTRTKSEFSELKIENRSSKMSNQGKSSQKFGVIFYPKFPFYLFHS